MILKTLKLSILMLLFGSTLNAQIIIDGTPPPAQLVTDYLIGNGVTATNITFTGTSEQIAYFDGAGCNIGLPFGLVMSSGNATDIVPPNQPNTGQFNGAGDPDLVTIAQSVTSNPSSGSINSSYDAAILEFDFVPIGDSVKFNFVFASEEYLTYVNSQYNDAFGFFISGPGFAGPYAAPGAFPNGAENLAFVPGTTDPITISTIHPGLNNQFYIENEVGHSFNGFTVPMEIAFQVVCGETYHFKFAVADCQDDYLDTGVFLEGGSFSSDGVEVAVATVTGDTVVYEGCTDADFIFSRPEWQVTDSLSIDFIITGTATDGVDFNTMVSPVIFPPGEDTVILNLFPIADGIAEGLEYITITAYTLSPCGDTIESSGTIWFLDEPVIDILESDTIVFCKDDSVLVTAFASGGFGPYSYTWSNGAPDADSAYVAASILGTQTYIVTATDQCGYSQDDTITVDLQQTLVIDTLISYIASACDPDGAVSAQVSGITGQPLYNWTGPGTSPNFIDATVWQDIPSGWYYFTVTDNVCVEQDSVFVDIENPPIADLGTGTSGCAPLPVQFPNNSQNATSYQWDFGGGNVVNTATMDPQGFVFDVTTQVMLIAYSSPTCADTAYVTIDVTACGCTDPEADNYDPNASFDDGSCLYPIPEVVVPNIFTPNLDGANNIFFMKTKNAVQLDYTIVNRWGNVMFETSIDLSIPFSTQVGWNGTTPSGIEAEEGTYFYTYVAKGVDGTEVDGHGFVQLVRD